MNVVNGQYSNFAWSSHEENGKIRISLVWHNDSGRRKSKATIRRDRKRYEQFIAGKSKSGEISDDESLKSSETSDCNDDNTDSDSEHKMDTSKPNGASRKVELRKRVQNHSTMKSSCSDKQLVNNSSRANLKVTPDQGKTIVEKLGSTSDSNTQSETDATPRRKIPRCSLEKIVMKVSERKADYLLAIVPGTRIVIEHTISLKQTKLVRHGDRYWHTYVKNVENDFEDVRTTSYMNEEVQNGILLMEQFLNQLLPK